MKIEVYYNLHRSCWSIRQGGLVLGHAQGVTLQDCTFKVSESGRQRVLREKRKNVHAVISGSITSVEGFEPRRNRKLPKLAGKPSLPDQVSLVSYNPFKGSTFYNKETQEAVHSAEFAYLNSQRKVIAGNLNNSKYSGIL